MEECNEETICIISDLDFLSLVILRFLTLTFRVKFVVDHIAKPYVKDQVGFDKWSAEMKEISQYQNVWCKM